MSVNDEKAQSFQFRCGCLATVTRHSAALSNVCPLHNDRRAYQIRVELINEARKKAKFEGWRGH